MNQFERRLAANFAAEVPVLAEITPGVVVQVWHRGKLKGEVRVGETYRYYDLASLTKIIFTASTCLHHFSKSLKRLHEPLRDTVSWAQKGLTPFSLLTHTAGLEWWLPIYRKLKGPLNPETRWLQLEAHLAKVRRRKRKLAVYSDLDLWMLGAYLRQVHGANLEETWHVTRERVGVDDNQIFFHPGNRPKYARKNYAPTERCPWRRRVMQAEVHDENTWSFGGVSTHAGLFGTIEGVAHWCKELRRAHRGESLKFGDPEVVRYFTARRIPRQIGDWGLGFMKPSRPRASCGKHFSVHAFGHTGFTGTSIWMDPKKDVTVIILSNRVHPTRKNQKYLELRPRIHNWAMELLEA